jgi:hypothetical protein
VLLFFRNHIYGPAPIPPATPDVVVLVAPLIDTIVVAPLINRIIVGPIVTTVVEQ